LKLINDVLSKLKLLIKMVCFVDVINIILMPIFMENYWSTSRNL